jgi:S-formylglutathione hydrolase FrmB
MKPGSSVAVVLADPPGAPYPDGVSLIHGWLPVCIQIISAIVLAVAIARRSQRWWLLWVPVAAVCGAATAYGVNRYLTSNGMTTKPIPASLWIWLVLTGFSIAAAIVGWPRTNSRHRLASVISVPLCVLCVGVSVNAWVGYFPTVELAWNQLTAGPLPDQTDATALRARQQAHDTSGRGAVVAVDTPSSESGFRHRKELVYLPPAWFATTPPPPLPAVMMIAGAFNTPADWLRTGNAISIADFFASGHDGNSPVLVFVDASGTFNNDTECVNGPRGNVADHLVKDVPPYIVSQFGVRPPGQGWGLVGFSMGGTCTFGLAAMHPDLFSAFVDIGGDIRPNVGSDEDTTERLFGGDEKAQDEFDPRSAMQRHGPYTGVAGLFVAISESPPSHSNAGHGNIGHCAYTGEPDNQADAAVLLCLYARDFGMDVAVVTMVGDHDWPLAAHAFEATLPWMAAELQTPAVPPTSVPIT